MPPLVRLWMRRSARASRSQGCPRADAVGCATISAVAGRSAVVSTFPARSRWPWPQPISAQAISAMPSAAGPRTGRAASLAAAAEPDQRGGESEVEDELVEECGVKGGVALVAVRAEGGVDAQRPRQARRAAEQLLVEVVADEAGRLGDEDARRRGVHEACQ